MTGLVSVRAYDSQQRFIQESLTLINYYSRPARVFSNLNRWIDIRLDLLGNLFATSLAAYLVYYRVQTASNTGFSLNMAGKHLWSYNHLLPNSSAQSLFHATSSIISGSFYSLDMSPKKHEYVTDI